MSSQPSTELISLEHSSSIHKDYFIISWNLGNKCNYSCSYCPPLLHQGNIKFPPLVTIISTLKEISKEVPSHKKKYIEFTGGEVTLFPDFQKLVQSVKALGFEVGIISNGSVSNRFWENVSDQIDHVCFSFHSEFANKKKFIELSKLASKKTNTHLNVMAPPNKVDEMYDLASMLIQIEEVCSVELQPIIDHDDINQTRYIAKYTQSELELLQSFKSKHEKYFKDSFSYRGLMKAKSTTDEKLLSAAEIISQSINDFRGFKCAAGIESIVIDYRGYIYRGKCKEGGEIGHIMQRPFNLPKEEILCKKECCHCNFDITTTKYRA